MLNLKPRHRQDTNANALPRLQARFGETLGRVLYHRGVNDEADLDYAIGNLLPAADLLGIDKAVAIIDKAIDENWPILVAGDFDCDGATSCALVVRALRKMGATVNFIVPDRFRFGYGLTKELVEHAYQLHKPKLIITVDNGISSHDGVKAAHDLGVAVVISDHHIAAFEPPPAEAVINPNQAGCAFASKSLVGVGVAFYTMGSLAKSRRQAGKTAAAVSEYLDLVALGTVADVGVLDKNNRILLSHGLQQIRQGKCCLGILALLENAGRRASQITQDDLGFAIAPRINAAGRMDNMAVGIECLLSDDWQRAQSLAEKLSRFNYERRQVEQNMRKQAQTMIENVQVDQKSRAVVLYRDDWHQGVIGIVAGRLKEQFYRPSVIFAPADKDKAQDGVGDGDLIKASARSIAGVHITDVIWRINERFPDLICHFGGHAMAAGLSLPKAHFERFCAAFLEEMEAFPESVFCEQKYTDGALFPDDFSLAFVRRLQSATVWGQGFAPPNFDGVFVVVSHRVLKDKHLKMLLRLDGVEYPIDAIWFNYRPEAWDWRAERVHVLYKLDVNEYQGNASLQLVVLDLAVVENKASVALSAQAAF